ncbi:MAG: TfoX/Sxy family protein [Gemmatimonadota bacterium]|nr:MAG: TfoX/Sxy family protein [Gemmatimonadota bacterium]
MAGDSFVEYVLDQLQRLGPVEAKAMFGGHGLYHGGVFFGVVYDGRLYFKTDETTRPDYEIRGMGPFRPNPKQTLKTYYEVPVDVLEDDEALVGWAERALAAAES